MSTRPALALLCAVLLCWSVPAHATSVVRLGLDDLVTGASGIVHGTVNATQSRWNEDHTLIVTDVHVSVLETLRGTPSSEVVVTQLGGTVGKLRVDVDGAASFRVGDEVVLFLAPGARGQLHVMGLSQGRFDVVSDPQTGEKTVRGLFADAIASAGRVGLAPSAEAASPEGAIAPLPRFLEGLRSTVRGRSVQPK